MESIEVGGYFSALMVKDLVRDLVKQGNVDEPNQSLIPLVEQIMI